MIDRDDGFPEPIKRDGQKLAIGAIHNGLIHRQVPVCVKILPVKSLISWGYLQGTLHPCKLLSADFTCINNTYSC